jgi:hypothetical protein
MKRCTNYRFRIVKCEYHDAMTMLFLSIMRVRRWAKGGCRFARMSGDAAPGRRRQA